MPGLPHTVHRVFLLSPARASGKRARLLLRPGAEFELARSLSSGTATLGQVFAFCSGLYFRGKLAYARRFQRPPPDVSGIHVITPSRGLLSPDVPIGAETLAELASVPVDVSDARFAGALRRSVGPLAAIPDCEVVLLGSIASTKYVETLLPILGPRLLFPREFVGRGDMSRGGLLLRCVAFGRELEYIPIAGAPRRGRRPPPLHPAAGGAAPGPS